MKKIIGKVIVIICVTAMISALPARMAIAQPGVSVSFQVFYDELSPYGQWIDDPVYGYIWAPSVSPGFRPYFSGGYWVMTDYGNMWISDYAWGWAPFHYGRWTYDSFYGWVWIPDTVWGPAWVCWRSSPGYYGWAPLSPGISVSMSFASYNPPSDWWVFIPPAYIHHPRWHNHYDGPQNNFTIVNQTTVINHTYRNNKHTYITGPRSDEVRNASHKDVTVYKVQDRKKPGISALQNNTVSIYRPSIDKSKGNAVPHKVKKAEHPIGKAQDMNTSSKNRNSEQVRNKNSQQLNIPDQRQPVKRTVPGQKQPVKKTGPEQKAKEKNNSPVNKPSVNKTGTEQKGNVKQGVKKTAPRQNTFSPKKQQERGTQQSPAPQQNTKSKTNVQEKKSGVKQEGGKSKNTSPHNPKKK
jgi:hypothetical protein